MIPTSIDGTDITGATIDDTDITEITVDGDTVFKEVSAPDPNVYFHDDFDDGKLQNRDDSATTSYNGVTGVYRPEWTFDNGSPTVTNGDLDYTNPDSAKADLSLDLSQTVTWEFTNLRINVGGNQTPFFGLFYEDDPVRSPDDFPPTLFPGYFFRSNPSVPQTEFGKIDSNGNGTTLVQLNNVALDNVDMTVTRTPSGQFTVKTNGSTITSFTDTQHTNPQYIGFSGRTGGFNQMLLDELKIF